MEATRLSCVLAYPIAELLGAVLNALFFPETGNFHFANTSPPSNPYQINGILFRFTSFPDCASSPLVRCGKPGDYQPPRKYCVFCPFMLVFRL